MFAKIRWHAGHRGCVTTTDNRPETYGIFIEINSPQSIREIHIDRSARRFTRSKIRAALRMCAAAAVAIWYA